jgi:hypothetical protein
MQDDLAGLLEERDGARPRVRDAGEIRNGAERFPGRLRSFLCVRRLCDHRNGRRQR